MNKVLRVVLAIILGTSTFVYAADAPTVSVAFAALRHNLDFTKAQAGEPVELKLLRSVFVGDQNVIPRDSMIMAHVAKVENEGKHIRVHLVLDNAKVGAAEIPIRGIIVAMAPPVKQADLASDPQASMMRSIEPSRNDSARSSATDSNSAVSVATSLHKESGAPLALSEKSQGALDIDGKIEWNLTTPPPETIIESKGKKLTLESGMQVLIRMAQPKVAER